MAVTTPSGRSDIENKLNRTEKTVEGGDSGDVHCSSKSDEEDNVSHNNGSNIRPLSKDNGFNNQFEEDWTSSSSSSSNDESDEEAPWGKSKRKKKGKRSENQITKKQVLLPPNFTIDWDNSPLSIQKILAYKELTPTQWSKKLRQMNTHLVNCGSMWHLEKTDNKRKRREAGKVSNNNKGKVVMSCSDSSDGGDDDEKIRRYLIRWNGLSYLHVTWELPRDIEEHIGINGMQYLSRFDRKYGETTLRGELSPEDEWGGGFFNSECCEIDRVLDIIRKPGNGTQLLIKWLGCSYSELSYESIPDLDRLGIDYPNALEAYMVRENVRARKKLLQEAKNGKFCYPTLAPNFKNKGKLRDHQLIGVKWILANWAADRSCILADEMGLGKTLQCLTVVWWLLTKAGQSGPCLIVAPLSTLQHWKREAEEWTGLNAILYHGSQSDRDAIIDHEMLFAQAKGKPVVTNGETLHKPQIIITTPGAVIEHFHPFKDFHFSMLVVDEAQRLKNANATLNRVLTQELDWESCILLTGTPIQNTVEELWVLLNFVDPHVFDDREKFIDMYGDITRTEQVAELNVAIQPYLLRRMKEDVEKSVPPKQETIVEVELTTVQKQYYRALYEQNTDFLLQGGIRNGPSLINLAMELRKCCNHPYLIKGAERAIHASDVIQGSETDKLVMTSGKLVLLDKLLPHLKKQGHRVLLFSQFVMLLDILDDYLRGRNYIFGRIDGSITGRERQRVIDRFQAPGSDLFIMLLSTKAGGQGINLTAADTVIIYDSDWNPQNDIQAQARCHRIGQTKNVKVYRLLTNKTYEQVMFQTASRKLGLDQAILQHEQRKSNSLPQLSSKEVENLLKHGAYDIFRDNKNDQNSEKVFFEESINSILSRSETRIHSGGGGGTDKNMGGTNGGNAFSKALFISKEGKTVDVDDPEFWVKVVGLKVPEKKLEKLGLGKRAARTAVDYSDQVQFGGKTMGSHCSDDESIRSSDLSPDENQDSDIETGPDGMIDDWSYEELDALLKQMLLLGYGQTSALAVALNSKRQHKEIRSLCVAIVAHMFIEVVSNMQQEAACKLVEERKFAAATTLISAANLPVHHHLTVNPEEEGGRKEEEARGDRTEKKDISEGAGGGGEEEKKFISRSGVNENGIPSKDAATTTSVVPEEISSSKHMKGKQYYTGLDMLRAVNELGAKECAAILKVVAKQCLNKHEVCRHALRVGKTGSDPVLIAKMMWKPRRLGRVLDGLKKVDKKLTQLDDMLEIYRVSSFTVESLHALMLREASKPSRGWTSHHDKWLLSRVVAVGWPTTNFLLKQLVSSGWPGGCNGASAETICTLKVVKSRLKAIVSMANKVRQLLCASASQKSPRKDKEALQGKVLDNNVQQTSARAQPLSLQKHPNPNTASANARADKLSLLKSIGQKMHVSLQHKAEHVGKPEMPTQASTTCVPSAAMLSRNVSNLTVWGLNAIKRVCCAVQLLGVPPSLLRSDVESEWLLPYCLVLRGVDIDCDYVFVRKLELSWERFAEFAKIEDVDVARLIATTMIAQVLASNPNPVFSVNQFSNVPEFWPPDLGMMDITKLKRVAASSRLRQILRLLGTWEAVLKLCWQLTFIPCVSKTKVPSWWSKGYHDAKLLFASIIVGYSDEVPTILPLLQFKNFRDGLSIANGNQKTVEALSSIQLQPRLDALRAGVLYWAKAPDSFYGKAHTKAISTAMRSSNVHL